jgi:hypothetical protein
MHAKQTASARRLARLEAHRYAMPVVRELNAPVPRTRSTQRELVVASLLLCDREGPSRRGRAA